MPLDFEVSPEDIKVFLDEADEQLQLLEEDIIKLEHARDDDDLIQEIFRAAHTLKGSSATLGHKKMADLTHAMENVLDQLRKHKLDLTTPIVDALIASLDLLREFKEDIAGGRESTADLTKIMARLGRSGGAPGKGKTPGKAEEKRTRLNWVEEGLLADGLDRGANAFEVTVGIDMRSPMPAVRAFQVLMALGEIGNVVKSKPTLEEVEDERVTPTLEAIVTSNRGSEEIAQAIRAISEIASVQVRSPVPEPAPELNGENTGRESNGGSEGRSGAVRDFRRSSRTVRVDVEVLDNLMNLVGELVIDRTRLTQILNDFNPDERSDESGQELNRTSSHIGRVTTELQEEIMRARMLPVENLFKKFPRMMRDLSQQAGKEVEFVMRGEETELDRSVIEEIGDPLMHLLRNAIDHAIEPLEERRRAGKPDRGTVILEASHEENLIVISVRDDGRGINADWIKAKAVEKGLVTDEAARRMTEREAISLIFLPGFSTAEKVTEVSGRGVGMDVVHRNIEKLNGSIDINSQVGRGTEFRIKLPLTLAIIRALLVDQGDTVYAIPLTSVTETIRITASEIQTVKMREVILVRGRVVPLLRLDRVFGAGAGGESREELFVVIVNLAGLQVGIAVEGLVGEQEVVIKSLGKLIGDIPGVSGATILGDGSVAIILDMSGLVESAVPKARTA